MWTSDVARQAGVNSQTLRFYERRGVLPKPPRRRSGYRDYPEDAVRIIRFVKRAQELGFTLDEAKELVRLRRAAGRRERVRSIAARKIAEIDRRIAELQAMRAALADLVHACHAGRELECPILEALEGSA
jgi:MerR family mercuric resistance operon transcriptional regulator